MGLPFFVTPIEQDVAAKTVDKITAVPRSAIRRQRTLRGAIARLSPEERRRQLISRGVISESNAENDYYSERARRSSPPPGREISPLTTVSQHRQALEDGITAVRDALSFERQHPPGTQPDRPSMPPVPESRDFTSTEQARQEIERFRQARHRLRRIARRQPAPTPPYTEADLIAVHSSGTSTFPRPPLYSPSNLYAYHESSNLANARGSLDEDVPGRQSPHTSNPLEGPSLSERVQTLTRLSAGIERSHRLLRQARLDGLGDRDRSLSPDGGAAWETLSIGIAPDPQPPSAASSFASTSAAAASTSSSLTTDQTSTSTAITSSWSTQDLPHDCDLSDADSTEDDEEDMLELADFNRMNRMENDRFWDTQSDFTTTRAGRPMWNGVGIGETEHLGGMQRIISRLAERDDIPDEWWAGAGLSRNLRRERTG